MNEAAVIALEQDRRAGLLAFLGMPAKTAPKDIPGSTVEILQGTGEIVIGLLLQTVDKKTAEEFRATRDEAFLKYFVSLVSLSSMVRVVLPVPTVQRLMWELFSEIEADLRDQGLARFGQAARDQAMFTLWTLRKISELAPRIAAAPLVPDQHREKDQKLALDFSFYFAWAQFHLSCLIASIRFEKAVNPDILDEICDGLRAAVNSYGLIRQAVNIREQEAALEFQPYVQDEEDRELMDSSMREIEADL